MCPSSHLGSAPGFDNRTNLSLGQFNLIRAFDADASIRYKMRHRLRRNPDAAKARVRRTRFDLGIAAVRHLHSW